MDELIAHIQYVMPRLMLFTNGIELVDESRNNGNVKVERSHEALEFKGFKISHTNIKYWIAT